MFGHDIQRSGIETSGSDVIGSFLVFALFAVLAWGTARSDRPWFDANPFLYFWTLLQGGLR